MITDEKLYEETLILHKESLKNYSDCLEAEIKQCYENIAFEKKSLEIKVKQLNITKERLNLLD